jgi:uncharacterized protein (DUF433 family)
MSDDSIITIEPGKRGGKPCIRGLRITVYDVLEYLTSDMTEDEILADFPDLTRADIRAKRAGHSIGNEAVAVCMRSVQEAAAECRHACETTW